MSRRRPRILAAGAALLALGLAACTADDADPAEAGDPAADGTRAVTIGALSISETAPLWAAVEAGVFAEHGLDVTVQPIQGGAQAMPALINGEVDLTIGQPFGVLRATEQGLTVAIIAGYAESYAEGDDINAVVAGAGTDLTRPADLAGAKVAVNSLGAAGDLTIRAAVEQDGGDPDAIEFVEVGFPDAAAQLEAGNIDAAWVPEPFVSMIVGAGGSSVVYPYQAVIPGLPTLVVQATTQTVEQDPELVASVREGLADAFVWAEDNDDAVRQSLVDNLSLPEEAAANLPLPHFTTTVDQGVIQALADLGVEHGYFQTAPDVDMILVD
ncbi:ABC transporter substrate-binding protein [Isoptericola croceus]|uniref:ABC transporter substrate-binding protein n=1 Tax=Isoptericola croceus TaxID=3031406 RepID=UPI0023F69DA8|nr:ABC transporter substrate-binding protein [Isoptericola croceus]